MKHDCDHPASTQSDEQPPKVPDSTDVVSRARQALAEVLPTHWVIAGNFMGVARAYELLAELADEVERLRAEVGLLRGEYGVRPMTDVESNLMTQVLDLRRQKSDLEAAVQRVREVAPQLELRKNEAAISASTDRFSAGAEHAYRASWLSLHSILAALDGSQQ